MIEIKSDLGVRFENKIDEYMNKMEARIDGMAGCFNFGAQEGTCLINNYGLEEHRTCVHVALA